MHIPIGDARELHVSPQVPPAAYSEWLACYQHAFDSLDGADIIEEMHDVADLLAALVKAGKTQQIGSLVCAVMRAYAERLADRECYEVSRRGNFPQDVAKRLGLAA